MQMKSRHFVALTISFLFTSLILLGQAPARPSSLFERLTIVEGTTLTLSTDVSALIVDDKIKDYQSGTLRASTGQSFEVGVRPRGKFRRRIATIPPLKIKVKKKLLEAAGLDTLNELKLVLPTTLDKTGEELLLREYIIYRMYEEVCDYHVRARLINLTLLNTSNKDEAKYSLKAILLEDEEETAARLGGSMEETFGYTIDSLQAETSALMVLFQYMIGNTDWSIPEQRNVRFLRLDTGERLPVPFDFDFAGLVNAPYATPQSGLGLRSVRDRRLLAEGIPADTITKAAQRLKDHKKDFYTLCRSGVLSGETSGQMIRYLDEYFQETPGPGR